VQLGSISPKLPVFIQIPCGTMQKSLGSPSFTKYSTNQFQNGTSSGVPESEAWHKRSQITDDHGTMAPWHLLLIEALDGALRSSLREGLRLSADPTGTGILAALAVAVLGHGP